MYNVKEGQFYYAPHRSSWGVWKRGETTNGCTIDDFVDDFASKEEARKFVFKANNWKDNKHSN